MIRVRTSKRIPEKEKRESPIKTAINTSKKKLSVAGRLSAMSTPIAKTTSGFSKKLFLAENEKATKEV